MAASQRLRVEGGDELARAMRQGAEQVRDLSEVHGRYLAPAVSRARSLAPILTGQLAGSVWAHAGRHSLRIGAGAEYAAVIEYGSTRRGLEPRPYLRPARDELAGEVARGYDEHIGRVLHGIASAAPA